MNMQDAITKDLDMLCQYYVEDLAIPGITRFSKEWKSFADRYGAELGAFMAAELGRLARVEEPVRTRVVLMIVLGSTYPVKKWEQDLPLLRLLQALLERGAVSEQRAYMIYNVLDVQFEMQGFSGLNREERRELVHAYVQLSQIAFNGENRNWLDIAIYKSISLLAEMMWAEDLDMRDEVKDVLQRIFLNYPDSFIVEEVQKYLDRDTQRDDR